MNNIIKSALCFITAIALFSCEEEVTPPQIEDAEDKIVVNGLIAPSFEQINVQVSKSKKAFGLINYDDSDIIQDATVIISNGSIERLLAYNENSQQYTLSTAGYPIEEGVTYSINVTALGKTVFGETTVPRGIQSLESGKIVDGYKVEVIWMDLAGEENYYRVVAEGDPENGSDFQEPFFFDGDEFVGDLNRDGQSLSANGEAYDFGGNYDRVNLHLISCDEFYYDYYEILVNYEGEDPFADPVRLPSNIEGGLGIFSSVQVSEFTIEK